MNRVQIDNELTNLYSELEKLNTMDEETVCSIYNVDFKDEAVSYIKEEIASLENELREIEEYEHREVNYFRTADNPYLCW